jgi:hypothetical protein
VVAPRTGASGLAGAAARLSRISLQFVVRKQQ